MPGGDKTGPAGMGPVTGRGGGLCVDKISPLGSWQRPYAGRFNQGGRGRGFRKFYCSIGFLGIARANQIYSEVDSIDTLKSYANKIQDELSSILERINMLEKSKSV